MLSSFFFFFFFFGSFCWTRCAQEHIGLKGKICHTGYVAWIKNVAQEDALLVQLLKKAGAVILMRTNEPQTLMHGDTNNNIYGPTVNPNNRLLSAGGSSGGEGASIRLRCAVMGVGTDIGVQKKKKKKKKKEKKKKKKASIYIWADTERMA